MGLFAPAHIVLLQKGWQALSGFVTALLVAYFLSPEEQGYYYAIGSLLSSYVLLDLGLSGLLVQISARMFPGLELRAGGQLAPLGGPRSSFLAMVAWSRRWYAKASLLALLLIPIGFVYFSYAKTGLQGINWQWPWALVVIAVALSMPVYPLISIIEGTGHIAEAYLVRLAHYGLGALLAWVLLAYGLGLYAPAMAPLAVALTAIAWLRLRHPALLDDAGSQAGFSWRVQVWPLQKWVALSWLASYAFLNTPTLIVFYFNDAVSAGQLGLSIIIANILGSLCASWLIAKVPRITHLAAQGQGEDSKRLFLSEFRKAVLLMLVAYGAGIAAVWAIGSTPIASRILPPFELTLLFGVFMVFHGVSMLAVYFRANGQEPMALTATLSTLASVLLACFLATDYGLLGVLISFLAIYGSVCVLAMYLAWVRQ